MEKITPRIPIEIYVIITGASGERFALTWDRYAELYADVSAVMASARTVTEIPDGVALSDAISFPRLPRRLTAEDIIKQEE